MKLRKLLKNKAYNSAIWNAIEELSDYTHEAVRVIAEDLDKIYTTLGDILEYVSEP